RLRGTAAGGLHRELFPALHGRDAGHGAGAGSDRGMDRDRPAAAGRHGFAAGRRGAADVTLATAVATRRAPARVHRSRGDEVYQELKRDVAEFKLVPGDRFTENELSERLGVSRTPVRQALFRLQQEGYVEVLFRSGWRVLPFDFEQFEQLYDLRMVLETTAVQRLCADGERTGGALLEELAAIWLVPVAERSSDMALVSKR